MIFNKFQINWVDSKGDVSLNGGSLKFVDKFTCIGCSISSTESDISVYLAKTWTAIDRLLSI